MGFMEWLTGRQSEEKTIVAHPKKARNLAEKIRTLEEVENASNGIKEAITQLNNVAGFADYVGTIDVTGFDELFENIQGVLKEVGDAIDTKIVEIEEYDEASFLEKAGSTVSMAATKFLEGGFSIFEGLGDGVVSIAGWLAPEDSGFETWCEDFVSANWSHDLFNFYYNSDFAKKSAFKEDSGLSSAFKLGGQITGYYIIGGYFTRLGTSTINTSSNVLKSLGKLANTSTRANTTLATVTGIGSGTESGIQQGLSINDAVTRKGLGQGLLQGMLAYGAGKYGEYKTSKNILKNNETAKTNFNDAQDEMLEVFQKYDRWSPEYQQALDKLKTSGEKISSIESQPTIEVQGYTNQLQKLGENISVKTLAGNTKNLVLSGATKVKQVFRHPINTTKNVVSTAKDTLSSVGGTVKNTVSHPINTTKNAISTSVNFTKNAVGTATNVLKNVPSAVSNFSGDAGIPQAVAPVLNAIGNEIGESSATTAFSPDDITVSKVELTEATPQQVTNNPANPTNNTPSGDGNADGNGGNTDNSVTHVNGTTGNYQFRTASDVTPQTPAEQTPHVEEITPNPPTNDTTQTPDTPITELPEDTPSDNNTTVTPPTNDATNGNTNNTTPIEPSTPQNNTPVAPSVPESSTSTGGGSYQQPNSYTPNYNTGGFSNTSPQAGPDNTLSLEDSGVEVIDEGTTIGETETSSTDTGQELDVISIDRPSNSSTSSESSSTGGSVIPTALGVGAAAAAGVAGVHYIKKKSDNKDDEYYEDEEEQNSFLGDYSPNDSSQDDGFSNEKYRAGTVNQLVLDDSPDVIINEDNDIIAPKNNELE